jgi:hypothetical protein
MGVALGGIALALVFWFSFYHITAYIGRAPARGKGIHPDAMRYFDELEHLLAPYIKDKDVIECLIAANRELQSQFRSYQSGTKREYPNALFGPESHGKGREEVWAIWVLLNYSNRSTIINNMQERLLKRMKDLANDTEARPPVLFEDCSPYHSYILECRREEEEKALKQCLTEYIARSNYRKLLPGVDINNIVEYCYRYRYDHEIWRIEDITQPKINKIIKHIATNVLK